MAFDDNSPIVQTKAFNASDTRIDPSTETTLLTRATQTTAAAIQTVLEAIRDTAGIKKIVDALPSGTNLLGKILLRSSTKGTSIEADLTSKNVDANIEALHISLADWLGSQAPVVGQKAMSASIPVTISSDQTSIPVTGGSASTTATISEYLEDAGGSHDMVVDGSVTPVKFYYSAHALEDVRLSSLRMVISAGSLTFNGVSFGNLLDPM
jgi:hypothetical protein